MKYSLLKEDDKAFHLMHPDGSSFQVAKKGIDEMLHNKIRKMVPQYMSEGGVAGEEMPLSVNSANQASMDSDSAPPLSSYQSPYAGSSVLNETKDAYSLQNPEGKVVNVKKAELGPSQIAEISSLPEDSVNRAPQAKAADASSGTPSLTKQVSDSDRSIPNIPAPGSRAPQDPFSLEEKGVKEQAKAEKDLGAASATAFQDTQNQLSDAKAVFDSRLAELNKRDAELTKRYEEGHIDPNRVISNMSTGNKVMAGIGLILGGLGGGALGTGQNDALKTLNNIVDKDIDAQKSELDKGKNLLSQNFERTHNLEQAHLLTKNDILGALEVNIKKLTANASSPMAQGKADMLLGQIAQQRQQNNMAMAQQMAAYQLAGGANTRGINPELLPEKLRERVVHLPGGGIGVASTQKDAEDVKKSLTSLQTLDKQIDDSLQFMKETGRTTGAELPLVGHVGSSSDSVASNMRNSIVVELNKLHDLNRLNPQELKIFESMVPSPGAWRQDKATAMLMSLRNFIHNKRASELQNHLSNYQEPSIPSQKAGFIR